MVSLFCNYIAVTYFENFVDWEDQKNTFYPTVISFLQNMSSTLKTFTDKMYIYAIYKFIVPAF